MTFLKVLEFLGVMFVILCTMALILGAISGIWMGVLALGRYLFNDSFVTVLAFVLPMISMSGYITYVVLQGEDTVR